MKTQSTPITASHKHHWEWDGGSGPIHFFFDCSKCGQSVPADYMLSEEFVDVADCPVLYSKPKFFKKSKWWLLLALGIEIIFMGIL